MLVRSFLIDSSLKLQVTRTDIKAWSNLILGQIRPIILEFLALEWWKFHTFELEYHEASWPILIKFYVWGKGCIRFWGRLDQNSGFHGNRKPPLTYNGENDFYFRPLVSMAHLYVFLKWDLTLAHWLRWAIVALWATCSFQFSNIKKCHLSFLRTERHSKLKCFPRLSKK